MCNEIIAQSPITSPIKTKKKFFLEITVKKPKYLNKYTILMMMEDNAEHLNKT
jgi:hypothetical protein